MVFILDEVKYERSAKFFLRKIAIKILSPKTKTKNCSRKISKRSNEANSCFTHIDNFGKLLTQQEKIN